MKKQPVHPPLRTKIAQFIKKLSYVSSTRRATPRVQRFLIPYTILVGLAALLAGRIGRCFFARKKRYPLAIVAIGKNESDYIVEWVAFHQLVGVDHIYLYDNDSTDGMADQVGYFVKKGFLTIIPMHGERKQLTAYNNALKQFGKECRYMAFIDCDEFLMPETYGDNICEILDSLLKKHKNAAGVAVSWCLYGSSGHKEKPNGLLIENFLMRERVEEKPTLMCIKTIAVPQYVQLYKHVHFPRFYPGLYKIDTDGRFVPEWGNTINGYKKLRINHYFTKSLAQWIRRRALGKADNGPEEKRPLSEFYQFDKNDVLDTSAQMYAEKVRKLLDKVKREKEKFSH